ncbi:MAG: hypothetical protein ACKPKO_19390, partial [Candidatus Fonsibacter sp.]
MFGQSFKANRHNIRRMFDSIAVRSKEVEDKAVLHILAVNKKRIESMLAILDCHSKHGLCAELVELME